MSWRRAFLLLLVVLVGSSCALPAGRPPAVIIPLEGTVWLLKGLGTAEDAAGPNRPFIKFDSGHLYGFGGCNRMSGVYDLVERRLRVRKITFTRLRCDDMATEQAFFDRLSLCDELQQDGPRLSLIQKTRPLLLFEAQLSLDAGGQR